jgi:toxin YoeB
MYSLEFTDSAKKDISKLKRSENQAYKKLAKLLEELQEHPYTGTGQPEVMRYGYSGYYSRRINKKHRLVYQVDDDKIEVLVISSLGHYQDK